jgi:BirA family biotin operon repressor/biotin-[acetyl-CoA-carboxylase] ligase
MSQSATAPGVLRVLLNAQGPSSGEAIGQRLGCSRAAVGKAVKTLREQGFEIEARTRLGYVLQKEPPALLPARMEARLSPGGLGLPYYHFKELDSSNLEARRRAEGGAPHGACICADFQSAGRGRLDRRWLAPPGACLLFSLILRPTLGLHMVFGLTNLMALAVCRAVESLCGLEPRIKWPNDVYLNGAKLCGILTEFTARAEKVEFVVVGPGINVNLSAGQLADMPAPAASLMEASGKSWDRALILAGILKELDHLYPMFMGPDPASLSGEYARRSMTIGQRIAVRDGEVVKKGRALGVEPDGALRLETAPGQVSLIRHGDVSVIKK